VNFIIYLEPPYLLDYNYIVVPLPTGFFCECISLMVKVCKNSSHNVETKLTKCERCITNIDKHKMKHMHMLANGLGMKKCITFLQAKQKLEGL
jgi:hypothetical protein